MNRYRLYYTVIFHPRPLQAGGFVGERKEVSCKSIFEALGDWAARLRLDELMNGKAKLGRIPHRTARADRLTEVDESNKDIREVPLQEN